MPRLSRKVAIVTGAAGGIGAAIATAFAREGAALCCACTADPEDVARATATAVERYGRLDILIRNAGIDGRVLPMTEYPIEDFDRVMAGNVRDVFLTVQHAMPAMQRGGVRIVITSSIAGLRGFAGLSACSASKHAVLGLFLASDESGFCSGGAHSVDGAMAAG